MKKKKQVFSAKPQIKKGDMVEVLAGDDAGKTGKVLQVIPQKGAAIVEGLNIIRKCVRKTQDNPQGGIVEREAPLALSKLRAAKSAGKKAAGEKK
ncbi:MAG TPA: 50S ribosomal protein L24 [Kiritimatiellia bacterium]|nr:50S ribosomal protein L24 [Kiritimatiellia bacterium]